MITIQSQDKQLWEDNHIGHGHDKSKAVIYCLGYVVGTFSTVEQRDYVLDQIASAIARGDKLYRMPSVKDVEAELSGKYCGNCGNWNERIHHCKEMNSSSRAKSHCGAWKPKE